MYPLLACDIRLIGFFDGQLAISVVLLAAGFVVEKRYRLRLFGNVFGEATS